MHKVIFTYGPVTYHRIELTDRYRIKQILSGGEKASTAENLEIFPLANEHVPNMYRTCTECVTDETEKNVHLADVYSSIKRTLPNVEWTSTVHVAHKPNMYSMYTGQNARPTYDYRSCDGRNGEYISWLDW